MEKVLQNLFFCHRLPERSFFFRGKQFPVCARCTGILVGYLLGIIYFFIFGRIPILLALIFLIPLVVDGFGQYLNHWVSTNRRRFITGIFAGIGTDFIIYWLIIFGFSHGQHIARMIFN